MIIGVHGDPDLNGLDLGGAETRLIRTVGDLSNDLDYLIVRVAGNKVPGVLSCAADLGIPTTVLVPELGLWPLTELLLRHTNVEELLQEDSLETLTVDRVTAVVGRRRTPGHGFRIGTLQPMPGNPDDYEARRFLSFVSPAMTGFLRDLRAALSQMSRERSPIPWDPRNRQESVELDDNDRPKGKGPYNLADLVKHARHAWAREILCGPAVGQAWQTLPPPLLLLGESGTGKTLVSSLIHDQLTSPADEHGNRGELVEVTAAAMDTANFDYDLFGATAGVWNDVDYRVGAVSQGAFGTVFLDEIGDMPGPAQTRLLTFFNDLTAKVQGAQPFFTYAQVLAATNRDLDHLVAIGAFRHDLLARFRSRVVLPPLRSRDDAELRRLIDFVAQNPLVNPRVDEEGRDAVDGQPLVSYVSVDAMTALVAHRYADGNFRELEQAVHTAIWRARGANSRTIELTHLELRPGRFRPDVDERVIKVVRLPEASQGSVVVVEDLDELARIAALHDRAILRAGSTYAVIDRGLHFRFGVD